MISSPLSTNGVRLQPHDGQKILVTTQAFKKGDPLLIVPSEMCLLAHRSGVISGLQGQTDQLWDEVGDLREPLSDEQIMGGRTWDVQLALGLLDATAGTGLGGDLWDQYALELPRPEDVTLPFCFGAVEVLDHVQCAAMRSNALKQQKRLHSISEVYSDPLSHRVTAASLNRVCDPRAVPSPLQWAFAMVRSRCFKVSQDWFAVVPVIDMANHHLAPSARFEMSNDDPSVDLSRAPETVFMLRATRDLHKGEEVTICYDQTYTNERLFVQYGFSLTGNPNDEVFPVEEQARPFGDVPTAPTPVPEVSTSEVDSSSTRAKQLILLAADRVGGQGEDAASEGPLGDGATPLRLHSVSRSLLKRLSATKAAETVEGAEDCQVVSALTALSKEVNALVLSYPSTLLDDKLLLARLSSSNEPLVAMLSSSANGEAANIRTEGSSTQGGAGGGGGGVSLNRQQLGACVRRRIERKQLLLCAQSVLDAAISLATKGGAE